VRHGAILSRRQDAELTLGMFMNLIRHVAGRHWAPREVHFEHPRPGQWHDHCKVFDAPVWFDQPFNSLVIPKRDLLRAMPESDPILLMVMQDAIRRLNRGTSQQSMIEQARSQVNLSLMQGELVTAATAARRGQQLYRAGGSGALRNGDALSAAEAAADFRDGAAAGLLRSQRVLTRVSPLVWHQSAPVASGRSRQLTARRKAEPRRLPRLRWRRQIAGLRHQLPGAQAERFIPLSLRHRIMSAVLLPLHPDQTLLTGITRRISKLPVQHRLHLISPVTGFAVRVFRRLTQVCHAIPLLSHRLLTGAERKSNNHSQQYSHLYIN